MTDATRSSVYLRLSIYPQVLSAKLVEFIATSADISAFVAHSDRTLDYNKVRLCDPNLHPLP